MATLPPEDQGEKQSPADPDERLELLLAMEPLELARHLMMPDARPAITAFSAAGAARLVQYLKDGADHYWHINPNGSLEISEAIIRIGQERQDARHTALGTMARGDALKFLGRSQEAWDVLHQAGKLFLEAGDEIGWARTRVGRLVLSVKVNRVEEALTEAGRAHDILAARDDLREFLLRLDNAIGYVYMCQGKPHEALQFYHSALATAQSIDQTGHWFLGAIYTNLGAVYTDLLGDFRAASSYYEKAHAFAVARQETKHTALAEHNLALIAMDQGHYREALTLLYHARDVYVAANLWLDATHVDRHIINGYLLLNRFHQARELAKEIVVKYHSFGATYDEADTYLYLAAAEAELADMDAAQEALDSAEALFASLDSTFWVATTRLRRGKLALKRGNINSAQDGAGEAAHYFQSVGQQVSAATAILLQAQTHLAGGNPGAAQHDALTALRTAQRRNIPNVRYGAHLVLGQISELHAELAHALRHYRAAIATIDRVQRGLTITLRPGFLEDKGEALRALIALQLRSGKVYAAFDALEHAKSQALLGHVTNRQALRWSTGDPEGQKLVQELEDLRDRHAWLYKQAQGERPSDSSEPQALDQDEALQQLATCERQMRAITERLYLNSGEAEGRGTASIRHKDVQRHLDDGTLLIEYYYDGGALHAFTLDATSLEVHALPTPFASVERLLTQLQSNIRSALAQDPHAPAARALAQRLLRQLHDALLQPLGERMAGRCRFVIVPYGLLHYLPFHLLRGASGYLIEDYEVVTLPAAGLITHPGPRQLAGARVVAHSANGHLPQVLAEAELVHGMFGGEVYRDAEADRTVFQAPPAQILHVASHAAFRLDQPDLSFIELADGQLLTDDLLQQDLGYELVTLSACETGRAQVAAGDELIGLGRGFLYAGAGALVASLWRVADEVALPLMRGFYGALREGASKAAALRAAQVALLQADAELHPAFWGPFQLVGDAGPLSTFGRVTV